MAYISNNILIKFLKHYGVRKLVLSSGTRNIPFVSSVEVDDDFECFSVVDERNAAFFGMGLAQESNELVAIACTSGTAVSNYVTGVTEAFYSNIPLIVITFDRSPYVLNQLETQKIDQMSIFDSITKANVQLPMIKDEEDIWYCERLLNEAFISLNRHGKGPIHINIPLVGSTNELWVKQNAAERQVKFVDYYSYEHGNWSKAENYLVDKKVIFVLGQDITMSEATKQKLESFIQRTNAVVLNDNLANFLSANTIGTEKAIKAFNRKTIEDYLPDVVLSYGLNFQERVKDLLKTNARKFDHWMISEEGKIKDCFKSQNAIFECSLDFFIDHMTEASSSSKEFLNKWKRVDEYLKVRELPYSNFYAIQKLTESIPNDSMIHLSILNATRLTQFFQLDKSVKVYGNVNSFGIDGCLPTFLGQAYSFDGPAYIVIGDLTFFYGMNALGIKHIKNNIRVFLINNHGGAEFHIVPSHSENKNIDLHIGASHGQTAKGWVESLGFKYMTASTKEEFDGKIIEFTSTDINEPVVFEVFTGLDDDGRIILETYRDLERQLREIINE